MAFYTICGRPDCPLFAHAVYVAQYLHETLPDFNFKKIEKSRKDWPDYVIELNKSFGWHMCRSPIIWKELSCWGGKPYIIGGLSQFWEYCDSYYGLESLIPASELEKLARTNLNDFEERVQQNQNDENLGKYGCVIGVLADHNMPFLQRFLQQILDIPYFQKNKGFYVKVYFSPPLLSKLHLQYIEGLLKEYNSLSICGSRIILEVVLSEPVCVNMTDVLIFWEDHSKLANETFSEYLRRCKSRIRILSGTLIDHSKRNLRVIFCNDGPRSLMATCMNDYCDNILPYNTVCLSADLGYPVIGAISEIAQIPVAMMGAPPVWGSIGLHDYVDEKNVVFRANIHKPYKRAVSAIDGSTLPLGTTTNELRTLTYLLPNHHDTITKIVENKRKAILEKLHRKPNLSKLRGLISLLELWFAEEVSDEIISLGVCSNGSFDILPGMNFSQPCTLNRNRIWMPYESFPLINADMRLKIQELSHQTIKSFRKVKMDAQKFSEVFLLHLESNRDKEYSRECLKRWPSRNINSFKSVASFVNIDDKGRDSDRKSKETEQGDKGNEGDRLTDEEVHEFEVKTEVLDDHTNQDNLPKQSKDTNEYTKQNIQTENENRDQDPNYERKEQDVENHSH